MTEPCEPPPKSQAAKVVRYAFWAVVLFASLAVVVVLLTERVASPPEGTMRRTRVGQPMFGSGQSVRVVILGWLTWFSCAFTSPIFLWLARRFPIARKGWKRGLAVHFAVTTVVVVLTNILWTALAVRWMSFAPSFDLQFFFFARYITESLPFWLMIAGIHAFEMYRRSRQHEVESAVLRAQLAESRLGALSAQLHPHFLFNTLQGISTLMHRNVEAADGVLSRLSDLLRATLQRRDRHEVPLSEELEVLDDYLAIARARFEDRVAFEISVSDGLGDALVPFFVLQPLVENAIDHGVGQRAGHGTIEIRAVRRDGSVVLSVTDDGPGMVDDERVDGIGLSNTRSRLEELYGEAHSMTLGNVAGNGFRVEITIPYRTAPDGDAE